MSIASQTHCSWPLEPTNDHSSSPSITSRPFLSRYIDLTRHCCLFAIDVALQPVCGNSCHPHNSGQTHSLQQEFVHQSLCLGLNRLEYGSSTNCRPHALQANLGFPLLICPFLITCAEPHSEQFAIALPHLLLFPRLCHHYPHSTTRILN